MAKRNNAVYPAKSDSTDEKKVFGKLNPYYGNRFCVSNSTVNEANEKKWTNCIFLFVRRKTQKRVRNFVVKHGRK